MKCRETLFFMLLCLNCTESKFWCIWCTRASWDLAFLGSCVKLLGPQAEVMGADLSHAGIHCSSIRRQLPLATRCCCPPCCDLASGARSPIGVTWRGSVWVGLWGKAPSLLLCLSLPQPHRAQSSRGAMLGFACSPSGSRQAWASACDPCLCAFLLVVCTLLSVPRFVKMWALLFKADKCVSKCICY